MDMKPTRRQLLTGIGIVAAGSAGWPLSALAQDAYPSAPVRLIVPFVAGSATDLIGRLIGQKLSEALGQPFVIDNRGGAGGNIGSHLIATAQPDGYTIGIGVFGVHALNPHLFKNMPFDSIADFSPIGTIGTANQVLAINPKIPVNTVQEFVEYARARPRELNFASPGNGSTGQLAASLLENVTGIRLTNVPFNGAAAARTSLLAGDTHVTFELVPTSAPHVKSGALKALAVTGTQRAPALPNVPTMIEAGYKDFEVTTWFSLVGPAKLPAPIVAKLNTTLNQILSRPDVVNALNDNGSTPAPGTPADLRQRMERDRAKWGEIIKKAGTKID